MEEIRVITTATVLSVRYSVQDAQDEGEVEYEVDAEDVIGTTPESGRLSLQIGDSVSQTVFESVREDVETGQTGVLGVMVPQHLLPVYLGKYDDELKVYPL